MANLIPIMTLLDWKGEHARCLAHMRLNTERWVHQGLLKSPADVRVRPPKVMADSSKRKNSTGRPRKNAD